MLLANLYLTAALTLGCGHTASVYDYIVKTMPEKSTNQYPMKGRQGETGRRFYIYSDGSWFLTFEYLSSGPISEDISCIVAQGPREAMEQVLDFRATELPPADIGKPVVRPPLQ